MKSARRRTLAAVLIAIFTIIIIIALVPFRVTETGFHKAIEEEIAAVEGAAAQDGDSAAEGSIRYHEQNSGLLRVLTFTYPAGETERTGIAIFVKHLFLPTYRADTIFIEEESVPFYYITAVDDFKAVYLVEVDESGIQIKLEEEMLQGRLLRQLAVFLLNFAVIIGVQRIRKFRSSNP